MVQKEEEPPNPTKFVIKAETKREYLTPVDSHQLDNFKQSEDMDVSKISKDSKAETHGVVELDLQQQLDQFDDNRLIKRAAK